MTPKIRVVDLFCGAGGTSSGMARACGERGVGVDLLAINHWDRAIETHAANHPTAEHLCETLDSVDPRKVYKGRKLDVLVASPECQGHSIARGGKPTGDQTRATGWHVIRWAEALTPKVVLVENVREWEKWGPLDDDGRPVPSRKGETFSAWLRALESLGYTTRYSVLNAADYGGATTRRRLFVVAVRGDSAAVPWPAQTHARKPEASLFPVKKWRAAREVIDWGRRGSSIFTRKKPLSANTLKRIEAGLRKFGGAGAEPFLVRLRGTSGRQIEGSALSVSGPVPTVAAGGQHLGLCEPYLVSWKEGVDRRVHSLGEPLPTQTTSKQFGLVEPFLVPTNYGEREGQSPRFHSLSDPCPTVVAGGISHGVVEPFLIDYHGKGRPSSVDDPHRTVDCKDRFGLVRPEHCDILFRMLEPSELAAAQGFPEGYRFAGRKTDVVKLIGNAVEVNQARALGLAILDCILGNVANAA